MAVPNIPALRRSIFYELHDAPLSGHPGKAKMLKKANSLYWWPNLSSDIAQYVKTCDSCQRNKSSNQKPVGLLCPLYIPEGPWDWVSMDFITDLPHTKSGYNCILVFVDRLTKMVHLAPTTTTVDAQKTAQHFMDFVVKLHGVPKDVVFDRGSVFTSHFTKGFLECIGTKQHLSTAFHEMGCLYSRPESEMKKVR